MGGGALSILIDNSARLLTIGHRSMFMYVVVLVKGRGAGEHFSVLLRRHLRMAYHSCVVLFMATHRAARVRPRSRVRGDVMIGRSTLQLLVLVLWHVVVLAILMIIESVGWGLAHVVVIARCGHH